VPSWDIGRACSGINIWNRGNIPHGLPESIICRSGLLSSHSGSAWFDLSLNREPLAAVIQGKIRVFRKVVLISCAGNASRGFDFCLL
jgi:hypothetical protein